jgi:hypothetical protein
MKNIKKNTLKIVVLIALFAPAAFADGDMPGGGLASNGEGNNGEVVSTQASDNGVVGLAQTSDTTNVPSILSAIYEYLNSMI